MISIIVPVIWKFNPFCGFISRVVELPIVNEVILINNVVSNTPNHPVLSHPKVRLYNQEKNLFTNPSWNLGVSLAKSDTLCILNDDVLVDLRVFFEANDFISKEIGLLCNGLSQDIYKLHANENPDQVNMNNVTITGDVKIELPRSNIFDEITCSRMSVGSGCLMFIHKDNWIDIPSDLKQDWGDTWQFEMQNALGRQNYYIYDHFFYSPWKMGRKNGVESDYLQSQEFWEKENYENFKSLKMNKLKELNIPMENLYE